MTAHVAEAGEQRGRVVLKLGFSEPSRVALEAAIRVAQAFQSEIESLFVEEPQLLEAASLPFTREVSLTGRQRRDFTPEVVARQMRHVAHDLMRRVEAMARLAEVPSRSTIVRDEPLQAMARACRERGPWNVIALADGTIPASGAAIRQLFERVADTTGVVFAGPRARTKRGPVVIALEDAAQLEAMLRAARRLAPAESEERVVVLLIADDEAGLAELEGQVRLALAQGADFTIARAAPAHGSPLGPAEALRRLAGGFIIAELGRRLVPAAGDLRHLASALECPLLVVR
jgi:hypothetical protein